jgi:GNAT superfamily N-acetyltransferase
MKTWYIIPDETDTRAAAIADVFEVDKEYAVITRLNVMQEFRGQGLGSKLLKMVLDDADKEGVILLLEIAPSGTLTFNDLEKWYERNGFVWNGDHMQRNPIKP